jgi:hypothetical protein
MTRNWRIVTILAVFSLMLAACTPQELAELFNLVDLRASDNPTTRAAGNAAEELDKDREAQQLVDEGLREKSPEKLEQAVEQRPLDPRYKIYQAASELANDNDDGYRLKMFEAATAIDPDVIRRSEEDDETRRNLDRQWREGVLLAFDQAIAIERERDPIEPERVERLERVFCAYYRYHTNTHGDTQRGAIFLALVNGAHCQVTP